MATVTVTGLYTAAPGDDTLIIANSQWVALDYGPAGTQGIIANISNSTLYENVSPLTPADEIDTALETFLLNPMSIIDQYGTTDTLVGFSAGFISGTAFDDVLVVDAQFGFAPNGGTDNVYILGGTYGSLNAPWDSAGVNWSLADSVFTYRKLDGTEHSVTVHGSQSFTTLVGSAYDDILSGTEGNDSFIGNGGNDIVTTGSGADIIEFWNPGGSVHVQDFSKTDRFVFLSDGRFGFDLANLKENFTTSYNAQDNLTTISTTVENFPTTNLIVSGEYSVDNIFIDNSVPGQVRLYLNPDVPQITLDAYSSPKYDEYSFKYFQTDFNNAGLNFDTTNMLVTSSTGFQYDLSDYLTNGRFLALGLTTGDDIITKDQSVYLDVFYFGGHDVINSSVHSIDTSVSVDGNGIARWAGYQNGESLYFSGGPGYTGNATVNIDAFNNLNINIFDDTGTTGTITGKNIERINISGIGDHTVVGNDFEHMFRFNSAGTDVLTAGGGRDFISIGTNAVDITFTDYEEGEWISLDRGWGFDPTQFASQLQARVVDQADGKYTYFSVINAGVGDKIDFLKVAGEFSVDQIHLGYRGEEPYSDGNDLFFTLTSVLPEVTGTDGRDTLVGGRDAEIIFGEAGGDTILGRGGNDELYGGSGRDNLRGGSGDDILNGGDGHDTLYGGAGSDFLFGGAGRDELKGNKGADTLEGGLGKDLLYAGVDSDMDTFVFRQIEDSAKGRNSDEIFQFDSGEDKIDLQFIDANTLLVGDQSFEFSEGRAAHSIWVKESDRDLLVRGDVDGDARHDFEIVLNNLSDITEYDFIL